MTCSLWLLLTALLCGAAPPQQLPPAQAYAASPEELDKYQSLFKTYDSDHDGYVPARHSSIHIK